LYSGSVLVSAVDENGNYQVDRLEVGDIWYFPKGSAHTVQGLSDEVSNSRDELLFGILELGARVLSQEQTKRRRSSSCS
jgi:hypothetical protein